MEFTKTQKSRIYDNKASICLKDFDKEIQKEFKTKINSLVAKKIAQNTIKTKEGFKIRQEFVISIDNEDLTLAKNAMELLYKKANILANEDELTLTKGMIAIALKEAMPHKNIIISKGVKAPAYATSPASFQKSMDRLILGKVAKVDFAE